MVSRDLDSLINSREAAAVQEWMKSGKVIYILHPYYYEKLRSITGCL